MLAFLSNLPDWMTSWGFMIGMFVVLLALLGVLMYMRNKRSDDE
jgi:hypothetical protein